MESVCHADVVRSGPFQRQDESTVSKGPYLEIRPLDRAQIFFTSFRRLFSMEQRGIDTTRRCRPVGAIPPTGLEYRFKRFVSIVPTVGSHSNFFHEFPEAVLDGVASKRYDTPMPSGRGHSIDKTRVPGQKVRISRSDRVIALKFFSRVSAGCFQWSSVESVRHADAVRSGPFHRQDESTVSKGPYLYIRPLDRALIFFTSFQRLFLKELRGIGTTR